MTASLIEQSSFYFNTIFPKINKQKDTSGEDAGRKSNATPPKHTHTSRERGHTNYRFRIQHATAILLL